MNTNGSNAETSVTVTATIGTNTLNLQWSTGGEVVITEILAYNSASKEFSVLNAGFSGGVAADMTDTTNPWSALNKIKSIAPALTVIMIGVNDWDHGTSLSSFTSSIQTAITAAKLSGDVILMSPAPSETTAGASVATQKSYVAAISSLAISNGIPYVDIFNAFGGTWTAAVTAGLMCNDGSAGCKVHPTTAGYGLIAAYLNTGLASGFKSADGRSTTTFDPSNLGSLNVLSNGKLTVTSSGGGGGTDSRKGF